MTLRPDAIAWAPRGLSREESARYVGLSPSSFDALVADKKMPAPKKVGGRRVWDRLMLDAYFADLGEGAANGIDAIFARKTA